MQRVSVLRMEPVQIVHFLGKGNDSEIFTCTIGGEVFVAKICKSEKQARREFATATALAKRGKETLPDKHPGVDALLQYRHYIPEQNILILDRCDANMNVAMNLRMMAVQHTDAMRRTFVSAVEAVVRGLHFMTHVAGVKHADLVPQNVLFKEDRGELTWYISDFGRTRRLPPCRNPMYILSKELHGFVKRLFATLQAEPGTLAYDRVRELYTLWQQPCSIQQAHINTFFPYLGDLCLFYQTAWLHDVHFPRQIDVAEEIVQKASMRAPESYL